MKGTQFLLRLQMLKRMALRLMGPDGQDHEAWKELADIYLEQQQLQLAKKALEEVVMLQVRACVTTVCTCDCRHVRRALESRCTRR